MKSHKHNILIILSILLLAITAGCSTNNEKPVVDKQPEQESEIELVDENDATVTPDKEEQTTVQDEEFTGKVKDEEGVIDGQVYTQDDMAIGALLIDEGLSQEQIDKLAQRYAEEIKKRYPDKTVNVQAVQDGENKANVVLD